MPDEATATASFSSDGVVPKLMMGIAAMGACGAESGRVGDVEAAGGNGAASADAGAAGGGAGTDVAAGANDGVVGGAPDVGAGRPEMA